jgi:membrane protein DedA with SNARE-associated domain/ribosomal protein S18 acetylase RimI-like enzyme
MSSTVASGSALKGPARRGDDAGDVKPRVRAQAGLRGWVPWQGPATRVDVALVAAILGVVALGVVTRPLTPFLLAEHPVLLGLLTGDLVAVGAGAAFARIGEAPLWLVVVAGAVGMVKFDWLTWWAGRQWGARIIRMFTAGDRAQRLAARATHWAPWVLRLAVVAAVLPGVPTAVVYAVAGWAGMRLLTFLLLDLLGAALITALVAGLGYGLGQRAVDVVLVIDRYASAVSLSLIGAMLLVPLLRRWITRSRRPTAPRETTPVTTPPDVRVRAAGPADADTVRLLVGEMAAHQDQAEHVTSTAERWRELLARDEVTVLLAEHDGGPVGYVSAVRRLHLWSGDDVLALDDLYVRDHARDLGIGRALMHELARRNAAARLTITWGVQPDNHDALRFYRRLGATLREKVVAAWPVDAQAGSSGRGAPDRSRP